MKFILILLFVKVLLAMNFTFEDLRKIKKGCADRGDCHSKIKPECNCQDNCVEYGDCCLSASAYNRDKVMKNIHKYECVQVGAVSKTYYMMWKCLESERNEEIINLCSGATPHYDARKSRKSPFFHTPVTSSKNNVTYKNYYCAICNNESISNLHLWNTKLEMPELAGYNESIVQQNLRLGENGSWGFDDPGFGFRPLDIIFDEPYQKNLTIKRCKLNINNCSSEWKDKQIADLCNSYSNFVYPKATPYNNYHCAMCNLVNESHLSCANSLRINSNPYVFSILFQFRTPKEVCTPGSIWDSFSKQCRPVVCLNEDQYFVNGKCVAANASTDGRLHSIPNPSAGRNINITSCDKILINTSDFTIDANLNSFVHSSQQEYKLGEYEKRTDGIAVCLTLNNFAYSSALSWISFAGLSLSTICLIVHLVIFTIVQELRNLSGQNLTSLCVALLAAYICFMITSFKDSSQGDCHVLASVMYYFFLASFTWMNVMAFDIWLALHMAMATFRIAAGKSLKKFIFYSIYAWTLPLIAIIVIAVIDYVKPIQLVPSFLPELGKNHCWFGQRNALLIFFALPLALIMTANIVFFVLTIKAISSANSTCELGRGEPYRVQIKRYFKLGVLMGLGWISGIVAGFLQNEFVWYVFVIMNTFQGLYILIAYTCTKKVRRALKKQSSKLMKFSANVHPKCKNQEDSPSSENSQSTLYSKTASTILINMIRKISSSTQPHCVDSSDQL